MDLRSSLEDLPPIYFGSSVLRPGTWTQQTELMQLLMLIRLVLPQNQLAEAMEMMCTGDQIQDSWLARGQHVPFLQLSLLLLVMSWLGFWQQLLVTELNQGFGCSFGSGFGTEGVLGSHYLKILSPLYIL